VCFNICNSHKAKKGASTRSILAKFRMFYTPVNYLCKISMFYTVTRNSYTYQHTICNHQKSNRQDCSLFLAIYTKVDTQAPHEQTRQVLISSVGNISHFWTISWICSGLKIDALKSKLASSNSLCSCKRITGK